VTGKLKIIKILKRSDSGIKTEPGTKDWKTIANCKLSSHYPYTFFQMWSKL
jgi:hypothetical protein